jgi:methenyltetrahydromethanopterin cyclohydrolase
MSVRESTKQLNDRAWALCQRIETIAERLRVKRHRLEGGAIGWDFGNRVPGGLQAGLYLARIAMADLADVQLIADTTAVGTGWSVQVTTDHPVMACMASQYAGWKLTADKYFAMGSGPMRAAAGREDLFRDISASEDASCAVGVLETSAPPPAEVAQQIAQACSIDPSRLCLLWARTASQAGTIQIVARGVETTLHKLWDLKFDLTSIVSGAGRTPLPPVASDDLAGIGRTNDAILYGADVTLWMRGNDDLLSQVIQQVPSSASHDYGRPFSEIFAQYDHDFYKIDPHLFSPARVTFVNLDTGRVHQAGHLAPEILQRSFVLELHG